MKFIPLLFMIFAGYFAAGQDRFGIKAGLNASRIGGDATNTKSMYSYNVGVYSIKEVSTNVYFRPELVFSVQGSKSSVNSDLYKYYYLNIPMTMGFKLSNEFGVCIGPQIGIITNALVKSYSSKTNVTANLNTFDLSMIGGLYFSLSKSIQLEARYNFGMSNTPKDPIPDGHYPNRVFQISLAYSFNKATSDENN